MSDNNLIEVVASNSNRVTSAGDMFVPAMTIAQAVSRYNNTLTFTREIMKEGKDYGTIPGSDKPCLMKPGAEKLSTFFGLTSKPVIVEKEEDWTGERHNGEPFFYYWYRVQLWRGDYLLGEADGSCNSMESKYRYRWVQEDQVPPGVLKESLKRRGGRISEFTFAVDKAETGGKYGKSAQYWQEWRDAIEKKQAVLMKKKTNSGKEMDAWERDATYFRVPNPDIADSVNTIKKMALKRALVAVTLLVCNASEYFTQDLEDLEPVETHATPAAVPVEPAKPQPPRQPSIPLETIDSIDKLNAYWHALNPKPSAMPAPLQAVIDLLSAVWESTLPVPAFLRSEEVAGFQKSLADDPNIDAFNALLPRVKTGTKAEQSAKWRLMNAHAARFPAVKWDGTKFAMVQPPQDEMPPVDDESEY